MKANKAVAAWLDGYDNPMKDVVSRVRDTILHADARIKESIKRKAPTFSYRGTLVSVFPESKKHASLMFERGAEIPGHHPRLEGSGDTGRVMKVHTVAEAHAVKDDLQHLVRSWCDWRDAEAAKEAEAEARAARKPAAKKNVARRKKVARPAAKKSRPGKKAARPAAKKARPGKKAARPAAKKARPGKNAVRPAAQNALPREQAARPAAKAAAQDVSSRQRAARPAATEAGRRSVPPRGLGRQSHSR